MTKRKPLEFKHPFGNQLGPWFRWFAWHPVNTIDRGWRWLRPVWRARFSKKSNLSGPHLRWFMTQVGDDKE